MADFAKRFSIAILAGVIALVVLYPVRGLLHINYTIIGSGLPYILMFPWLILIVVGGRKGAEPEPEPVEVSTVWNRVAVGGTCVFLIFSFFCLFCKPWMWFK